MSFIISVDEAVDDQGTSLVDVDGVGLHLTIKFEFIHNRKSLSREGSREHDVLPLEHHRAHRAARLRHGDFHPPVRGRGPPSREQTRIAIVRDVLPVRALLHLGRRIRGATARTTKAGVGRGRADVRDRRRVTGRARGPATAVAARTARAAVPVIGLDADHVGLVGLLLEGIATLARTVRVRQHGRGSTTLTVATDRSAAAAIARTGVRARNRQPSADGGEKNEKTRHGVLLSKCRFCLRRRTGF